MRCSITGVYFIAAIFFSSPVVQGNQDHTECELGFSDESSLLQAAASAKGSKAETDALAAKRKTPVCVEPEASLNVDAVGDPEPPAALPDFRSTALESVESSETAPAPALVFVLRAALWFVSLGVAASFAMRWFPRSSKHVAAADAHASKEADPMVVASQRALHEAALAGDDLRCQSLLDMAVLTSGTRPPDVIAAANAWGTTALHAAAMSGARAVVDLFLEHGTPVNPVDAWDETPLHLAARGGHVAVCELLIMRGASLRVVNAEDMTPLVVAAHAGQEATCSRLLELGAGVEGLSEEELPDMLHELMVADVMARAMTGPTSIAAS